MENLPHLFCAEDIPVRNAIADFVVFFKYRCYHLIVDPLKMWSDVDCSSFSNIFNEFVILRLWMFMKKENPTKIITKPTQYHWFSWQFWKSHSAFVVVTLTSSANEIYVCVVVEENNNKTAAKKKITYFCWDKK